MSKEEIIFRCASCEKELAVDKERSDKNTVYLHSCSHCVYFVHERAFRQGKDCLRKEIIELLGLEQN